MSSRQRSLLDFVYNKMDQSKNDDGWSKFAKGDVNYETFYYVTNMILAMCGTVLNVWALAILLQPSLRIKGKFVLIISMSVIDLLACVSMIGYLNYDAGSSSDFVPGGQIWGNILCRLVLNRYLTFWLSAISAWHVVMICIERYISVRSPGKTEWLLINIDSDLFCFAPPPPSFKAQTVFAPPTPSL